VGAYIVWFCERAKLIWKGVEQILDHVENIADTTNNKIIQSRFLCFWYGLPLLKRLRNLESFKGWEGPTTKG